MTSIEEADEWVGRTAVDNTGEQIGMISQIWVDDTSGQPEWASVRCIGRGEREVLIPLAGVVGLGGGRQFAYGKEQVLDAPPLDQNGSLSPNDLDRISAYYSDPGTGASMAPTTPGWIQLADAPRPPVPDFLRPPARAEARPVAKQARRRFGRKPAASDNGMTHMPMQPDEMPAGG